MFLPCACFPEFKLICAEENTTPYLPKPDVNGEKMVVTFKLGQLEDEGERQEAGCLGGDEFSPKRQITCSSLRCCPWSSR